MKFSINQSELQDALAVVLKGIATRSTLPILSGIYLDAHNDNLTLQATDLELSIQFTIPALVEEEGRSVFPGKLFFDILHCVLNVFICNDSVLICNFDVSCKLRVTNETFTQL